MNEEDILKIEKSLSKDDFDKYIEILWGISTSSRWGAYFYSDVKTKEKALKRLKNNTKYGK